MLSCLPPALDAIAERFAPAFTKPSLQRLVLLCAGLIIALRRRTVSRALWAVRFDLHGSSTSYHRLFSQRRWKPMVLGRLLTALVLEALPPDQPVTVAIDDHVAQHRGKRVWGKGCHRDGVRSSWGKLVHKWGHKWVTLAMVVPMPFCGRSWALPVLCALYLPAEVSAQEGRRHKTSPELARGLLALLVHWFPQRRFIVTGDWAFGTQELAAFCHRHRRHLTLIARIRGDAALYALRRPPQSRPGRRVDRRPRQNPKLCRKGSKLPAPKAVAATARPWTATLRWYGSSLRPVQLLSGCGGWYGTRNKFGATLTPLRWVFVRDTIGQREDYFYSTDPSLPPQQILETFTLRWSIEVTFEEIRAHLGFETTRQRSKNAVLRMAPTLMGLFTLVSLVFARLCQEAQASKQAAPKLHSTPCYTKTQPTFADALAAVRRELWSAFLLRHALGRTVAAILPPRARSTLLEYLCEAA